MSKKGGAFEKIANELLKNIFHELGYTIVRERTQDSGTQDGFDNLIEFVDDKFRNYIIYSECKDYKSNLNYTQALEKIPHIVSTHRNIDLLLFISPFENFSNTNENSKLEGFYQSISEGCPVEFLMPESYVRDYFSLYPELYKKVYNEEIFGLGQDRRNELLKQFEKLIFSSKNLKRIVIDDEDREEYIGKITKEEFHIPRNFRKYQDRGFYVFENPDYQIELDQFLDNSELGVFVLGNPGYGKSKELKNFAVELWESRNENLKIPKFQYLRTFNTDTKIADLLPKDYKYISYLTIIFDGLDEIHNIIDFTNKLQNFITENSDIIKNNSLKFVISCRTSIYNKYVKDLSGFEICFLNEVSEGAAVRFLLKKYNLDLRIDDRFNFWKYREIFENPFYLDLLGEYYKNTSEILLNKSKLIEKYVQSRLDNDESSKYRNDKDYEKTEILNSSKRIALAMEAMQKTSITKSEILAIYRSVDVYKNPFLQEDLNTSEWSFEHKNIQEYFVAKVLSTLTFEEIIDFIRIDVSTNKIHPTWNNVVSFLLNLDLPKITFDQIVQWISKNDIQFIFEADYNRISDEIRIESLQQLFEENCIKNTLWIDNASEIGCFGNVQENVSYLIEKAKDSGLHTRARISAINLLSHMKYSIEQTDEIKSLILQIIEEFEQNNDEKIYLLHDSFKLIQSSTLKENFSFYQCVFDKLKPYDYKDVVDGIVYTIPNKLIELNIDYFLEILDKSIGEKRWVYVANTRNVISRKENIFDLFKKIDNPESLLKIYSFLIDRHKNNEIRESLIKDFLLHLKLIFVKNPNVSEDLITIISNAVITDKIRYFEDDLLVDLVKSCHLEKDVFFKIFNTLAGNYSQKSFLSEIVKEEFFPSIVEGYNKGNINDDFITGFRNIICVRDEDLAITFENIVEKESEFRFVEKVDKEKRKDYVEFHRTERQREFNVLFQRDALEKQMATIFKFKKKKDLSHKNMDKFYKTFYKNDELREKVTINAKDLLCEIIRKEFGHSGTLNIDDLSFYISKYDVNILIDIQNALPKEDEQNIVISTEQKKYIENWCVSNSEKVKSAYNEYMLDNIVWLEEDYLIFETIFKFQKYFKFNLDEELLLNMIWLSRYMEDMNLDFIAGIVPKEKIDQRIIENANQTTDANSISSYVKYFLENNLDLKLLNFDIKEKVREFLLTNNDYYARKLVELLYSNDFIFLQEIIDINYLRPKKYFLDFVLGILIKQGGFDIVERYLKKNYDALIKNDIMEEHTIIKNLIMANSDLGFKNLKTIIEKNPEQYVSLDNGYSYKTWQNYSNEKSIDDLVAILNISLLNYDEERINRVHFSPIRISTETIVNICKNANTDFCKIVMDKLNQLDLNEIAISGGDLFFINKLKKDVQEISFNHKSKPYNLKNVLNLLDSNKHIFY
ncbi:NACHT domain-containing protein [uncultured Chryseobacterium sp.]|uniref:NACHT domain-containing protein n=1 Tax=uncultured Chryseobacterium sp. TaxID=259322 RepID=UPI00374785EA